MNRAEFKRQVLSLFSESVDGLSLEEKVNYIENLLIEYQKMNEDERDTSNKGESWTDEELKIVLSSAPTKYNCMKYARIFKRGYGSIEQIYRWAATTDKMITSGKASKRCFCKTHKKGCKRAWFKSVAQLSTGFPCGQLLYNKSHSQGE